MVNFIYWPLTILGLAALITVGTISPTNPTTAVLTPQNAQSSCNIPQSLTGIVGLIFTNPLGFVTSFSCYAVQGAASIIFNIPQINQYGYTVQSGTAGSSTVTTTITNSGTTSYITGTAITTCSTVTLFNANFGIGQYVTYLSCNGNANNPSGSVANPQSANDLLSSNNIQEGFLILILTIISVAVIGGINIFGTGLNAASIYIMFKSMGYTFMWLILSSLAMPLFFGTDQSIPAPFGSLAYLILSALFTIGILNSV